MQNYKEKENYISTEKTDSKNCESQNPTLYTTSFEGRNAPLKHLNPIIFNASISN
jgi:hypothetical protein